MHTLNLGILAHVDAGKTSLTERLLFAAGVIDQIGRVDDGTTQTDSLALERQRGITIKAAVVSFAIGDVTVNLLDTPGHPDFIAEVERVLTVLDGAVLVISAVEGVQAQTRVLLRTLRRLGIPTLIFVNKIDRRGPREGELLAELAARLTPDIIAMGKTEELGTRGARFVPARPAEPAFAERLTTALADHDDAFLADYLTAPDSISPGRLHAELAAQTGRSLLHPVFFGSAVTGAGIEALRSGLTWLLPGAAGDADGPVSGAVFKVDRGPAGEKVAYARIFTGTVRVRDLVRFGHPGHDDVDASVARVTGISVFDRGATTRSSSVAAGRIARIAGLAQVRVGDVLGEPRPGQDPRQFAPPTLETVVVPARPADKGAVHAALTALAEQDPLINLRQDEVRPELTVSLYGEVQKEVIQSTLALDFGLAVEFRETTVICAERVAGSGSAVELLHADGNPFLATIGLRIEPAPRGSGIQFRLEVDVRLVPLYVYKTTGSFAALMTRYIRHTLREGLLGWPVSDCTVTMTDCGYSSPGTGAADFRKLTPLVLMAALRQAGTVVCEPVTSFRLELPGDTLPATLGVLARLGGVPEGPQPEGRVTVVTGHLPTGRLHALQQQLPGLTRGEGLLDAEFGGYQPVRGTPPSRPRTDGNPLNRKEYLLQLEGGLPGRSSLAT